MTKEEYWNEKKNLLLKEARSYRAFELGIRFSEKRIEELEKENAILNEKVNILDNCDRLDDVIIEAYKDQLTTAIEIIREFVEWANWQGNSKCPSFKSIQYKAEQFLDGESTTEQPNECHDCAKFDEMPKGPRCKTCDNGSHFQKKEELKRSRWHNLRKNPQDLPKEDGVVLVVDMDYGHPGYKVAMFWKEDGAFTGHYLDKLDVIAWQEIPVFQEEA